MDNFSSSASPPSTPLSPGSPTDSLTSLPSVDQDFSPASLSPSHYTVSSEPEHLTSNDDSNDDQHLTVTPGGLCHSQPPHTPALIAGDANTPGHITHFILCNNCQQLLKICITVEEVVNWNARRNGQQNSS